MGTVRCSRGPDSACTAGGRRPRESRSCNLQPCPARWFSTQWSDCAGECGAGAAVRTREVVCLYRGQPSQDCRARDRPARSQACTDTDCANKQEEYQDNEIDSEEEYDDDYDIIDEEDEDIFTKVKPSKSFESKSDITSNEVVPEKHKKAPKEGGVACKDKFKNCNVVVQSRLCKYSFYQTNCCRSCVLLNKL